MSTNQDWPNESRQQGMSTTSKVLLALAGVGGICMLLCCGGGIYLYSKLQAVVQNVNVRDPAIIEARALEITDITIPEAFKPQRAATVPFMNIKFVVYAHEPDDGSALMLGEFPPGMGVDREQMRLQLRMQLQQQGQAGDLDLQEQETKTREYIVRGEPATFEFKSGKARGRAVRQVVGTFKSKGGTGMLMLSMPEDLYDEVVALELIDSLGAVEAPPKETDGTPTDNPEANRLPGENQPENP